MEKEKKRLVRFLPDATGSFAKISNFAKIPIVP
jgi:hypothetical protein